MVDKGGHHSQCGLALAWELEALPTSVHSPTVVGEMMATAYTQEAYLIELKTK